MNCTVRIACKLSHELLSFEVFHGTYAPGAFCFVFRKYFYFLAARLDNARGQIVSSSCFICPLRQTSDGAGWCLAQWKKTVLETTLHDLEMKLIAITLQHRHCRFPLLVSPLVPHPPRLDSVGHITLQDRYILKARNHHCQKGAETKTARGPPAPNAAQ